VNVKMSWSPGALKKIIPLGCGLIVGMAGYFAWKHFSPQPKVTADTPEVLSIPATKIVKKTLFREDQFPGEIRAYQDVAIYPKVPGFIKWIGVDRGSIVKQGQSMVTMYAPEYI